MTRDRNGAIVPGVVRGHTGANMLRWVVAFLVVVMEAREGLSRGLPTVVREGAVRSSETSLNSTEPLTCPTISLSETSLMVRVDRLRGPAWTLASGIRTECWNSDGTEYDPVYTGMRSCVGSRTVQSSNRPSICLPFCFCAHCVAVSR